MGNFFLRVGDTELDLEENNEENFFSEKEWRVLSQCRHGVENEGVCLT